MRAPFTPWAERPGTIVAPSKPPTLYPLTTHQLAVQGRPNPLTGKLYTGGDYKGHFALVGVTDSGEVAPEPSATLWGDANSDVQVRTARHVHGAHLYLNPSCRPRYTALVSAALFCLIPARQSTEPLRCGDGREREDDQKLVDERHGHPSWLAWPWSYCQPSPS